VNQHLQQFEPIILRGVADYLWPPGTTLVHLTDDERVLAAHRLVLQGEAEACRCYAIALSLVNETSRLQAQLCLDGLPRLGASR
jgi:hypothetical protein